MVKPSRRRRGPTVEAGGEFSGRIGAGARAGALDFCGAVGVPSGECYRFLLVGSEFHRKTDARSAVFCFEDTEVQMGAAGKSGVS